MSSPVAKEGGRQVKDESTQILNVLKEILDNSIKARGCTDGRSQREYMSKEATSFPTVSFKAMMISCATDAWEG